MSAKPTAIGPSPVGVARFATATLFMLILDRVFALAFTVLMSASYGASRQLDGYLLAVVGPMVIATLLGDLFYSLLLPELMQAHGSGSHHTWDLLAWVTAGSALVTGIYALGWTLVIQAAGRGDDTLFALGLITSLLIVLGGMSAMGGTVLVSEQRYIASTARIPLASLVSVVVFVLAQRLGSGIFGLALSVVAGALASTVLMFALVAGTIGRPRLNSSPTAGAALFRRLGSASLAQIAAGVAALAPTLIERVIAFPLGTGIVSALNYGRVLVSPPLLVAQSIATASYPRFVQQARRNDDRYRSNWAAISMVVFLVLPLSVLLAVLAQTLVLIVYHRGAFDEQAVTRTTATAAILSVGLVPTAISAVLTRFLYAERAFGRVALAWLITVLAYTVMAFSLGRPMGYIGIAIASAASNVVLTIALLFSLPPAAWTRQQLPWRTLLRTIAASAVMAAVLALVQAVVGNQPSLVVRVVIAGGLIVGGSAVYVFSAWALRSEELPVTVRYVRYLWAATKSRF